VATIDNGAWMYDGEKLINFTPKDGLSMEGIGIWTIYKDKEGKLWFGTEGDGVYTFDGKKMDKFKP
jgi:ligand-binding sensor domain-containing protein